MPFIALPAAAATIVTVGTTVSSAYAAAAAVAAFAFRQILMAGASRLAMQLIGPKQKKPERQASVTNLSLGEQPRVAVFGRAAVAGTAANGGNYGGNNMTDWEVLVIALADHECDALEGFWIDDAFYEFDEDGEVEGFDGKLKIYFRSGAEGQTFPESGTTPTWRALCGYDADDNGDGVCYVVVAYKWDEVIWSQGRPSFLWKLRGAKLYDPRLDSTVDGGDGPHRWDDPSTWEWSENAYLCRYNWARGLFAQNRVDEPAQLMFGRGLTALEAPPERAIARANICDEAAPKIGGGTEPRYRVGGVVTADEDFLETEERFAAAMAGVIVQSDGGVDIEPGAARTAVFEITDADLVVGEDVRFNLFGGQADRVNTVIPRYVEPGQKWQDHAASILRDPDDVLADGGPMTETLSLELVTSASQAQRIGEIRRRLARLFRSASLVLGPRFQAVEEGDWCGWTSERWLFGERVEFRVTRASIRSDKRVAISLEEIEAEAFEDPDLITPGTGGLFPPPSLSPLELSGVSISATSVAGVPAILGTWTTPVETDIVGVILEVRRLGETESSSAAAFDPNDGMILTTNGVRPDGGQMQGRLIPRGAPTRIATPSAWVTLSMSGLTAFDTDNVGGRPSGDLLDEVDGLLEQVETLVSDGVLQPADKLALNPQIDALLAARTGLEAQGGALGVTTALTAYSAALDDLEDYLATLTDPEPWDDLTGPTDVDGPTLVALIAGAVAAQAALQSAITEAARQWGNITGPGRPADNATVGATWGVNLGSRPANLASLSGSEPILNTGITLNADGTLSGAGGGAVTIGGLGFTGALNANYITATSQLTDDANLGGTATWSGVASRPANLAALSGSEPILNTGITLNADGSLSGAGGGAVTLSGLGFTGATDATNDAAVIALASTLGPLATSSLTEAKVQGRFFGEHAGDAAANTAGLQDGDAYVDTSVTPYAFKVKSGGTIKEVDTAGMFRAYAAQADVNSGTLTTIVTLDLTNVAEDSYVTVWMGLFKETAPAVTRKTSGGAGVNPGGSWRIQECATGSPNPASDPILLSGSWTANRVGSGANPDHIDNFDVDGSTTAASDISRRWLVRGEGSRSWYLQMARSGSENLSDAGVALYVQIQRNPLN